MKKIFTSFVFIVLFAGYAAFQYLNSAGVVPTAVAASQPVVTAQTQTQAQPAATPIASAQSAPPPGDSYQENAGDGGSDDASESGRTQQPQATPQPTTQQPTKTPAQTAPAPVAKPKGQYVDGSYTGSVANAFYGNVQVKAIISGGKLANVVVLQYPNDQSTSRFINQQAMPILVSEAIQAQSANVNGVSGASESSPAFMQSLASALAQAKS